MGSGHKYTETGAIRVTLNVKGATVNVTVKDTGIGIEKEAVPHLFDRFWRADKVRARSEGGAGLGLSMASQIVQRYDRTISVESEVGRGSSFTVQIKAVMLAPSGTWNHAKAIIVNCFETIKKSE